MKSASIIAIVAALAYSTAEAKRNLMGGNGGSQGIPDHFKYGDGALVGCRIQESPDAPIGGGIMHQNEGEAVWVRSGWKELDFWGGFDDTEFDPRSFDLDVYVSTGIEDCMDAATVHTALGSFDARDTGKGRFFEPAMEGVMLSGTRTVVGHYLGIAVNGEMIQCCKLADLRQNAPEPDQN